MKSRHTTYFLCDVEEMKLKFELCSEGLVDTYFAIFSKVLIKKDEQEVNIECYFLKFLILFQSNRFLVKSFIYEIPLCIF